MGFFSVLLLCGLLTGIAQGEGFQGELLTIDGKDTTVGQIYVLGDVYRTDVVSDGDLIQVVVNQAENTARVQIPREHVYLVLPLDDHMVLMNEPFQGWLYTASRGEVRTEGQESVAGYDCRKEVLSMSGQDFMARWYSEALAFPVRIVHLMSENRGVELRGIREETPDAALFAVPRDYTLIHDPRQIPVEPPEWAPRIPDLSVETPPFEKPMQADQMVRIPVVEGKSLVVRSHGSTENADARVVPFKDGRPTKEIGMINNFGAQGTAKVTRNESTAEADVFVLRVFTGETTAEAKYVDMSERDMTAGDTLRVPLDDRHIEFRILNLTDGDAGCSYDYYLDGQLVSDDEAGPAKYRQLAFTYSGELVAKTIRAFGNEMVLVVTGGRLHVKIGQLDTFTF